MGERPPSPLRRFWLYAAPSVLGMLACGVYTILDTIFIGRGAGELGLAAVALTWPLTMIFMGLGDVYGAGATTLLAQAVGAHDGARYRLLLSNAFLCSAAVAILLGALLYPFVPPILVAFGGDAELLPEAIPYARIVIAGSCATLWMSTGLGVLRAEGRPVLAMTLMCVGFALNILLDVVFLLVLRVGAHGAGYAFILSQLTTALLCLVYLYTPWARARLSRRFNLRAALALTRTGLPIFGNTLSVILMLYLAHLQSLRYGGNVGMAAYTVVASLEALGTMLMTGLALGVQPLVAEAYGQGDDMLKKLFARYGVIAAVGLGLVLMGFFLLLRHLVPAWSGFAGDTATLATYGIAWSAVGLPLFGVLRVAGFYYQSTGRLRAASLLIYGDSFIILPLCVLLLPYALGMNGLWLAMPLSRLLLLFALLALCRGCCGGRGGRGSRGR